MPDEPHTPDPAGKGRLDAAIATLYEELHARAKACFQHERKNHTLQPTALVHEVYLRLAGSEGGDFPVDDRVHFFAYAATVMRHILVNHAHRLKTKKRGGGFARVPLDGLYIDFEDRAHDLLALDEALETLARQDARKGRIIELRFFGGLSIAEVAQVMQLSHATIEREWRFARAWLHARICPDAPPADE